MHKHDMIVDFGLQYVIQMVSVVFLLGIHAKNIKCYGFCDAQQRFGDTRNWKIEKNVSDPVLDEIYQKEFLL